MSAPLTDGRQELLQWLADNGGEAVLDRYHRAMAGGERKSQNYAPTFLSLFISGHIESAGVGRFRISELGKSATVTRGNPVSVGEYDWSDPRVQARYGAEQYFDPRDGDIGHE